MTGAAHGLGREMALALAAEGCDVAGFDIQFEALAELADEIRRLGREAPVLEVDVRNYSAVHEGVAEIHERFGDLDILVNNAGKGQREDFCDISRELWDYMVDVNLTSVYNLCSAVVPRMLARGDGRIVNVSSVAALRGGRLLGRTAYAAAKAGVIGFTKALAFELAPHRVTVNCVAPGVQNTPRRALDTPEEHERLMSRVPMRAIGEPKDLAQTVVFLCLPSSRYITGIVLPQDGGHSI